MDNDDDDMLLLQACIAVEQATAAKKTEKADLVQSSPGNSASGSVEEKWTNEKMLPCLKRYFGHSAFRPYQEKIVGAALDRRDQLVVMATGYGKSLCYQFPALLRNGLTVVISPLISLMEDQVTNLSLMGVKAAFLGSSQSKAVQVRDNLLRGEYSVLYITPEYANTDSSLLTRLSSAPQELSLVAIDEAHCISQWGHDFREVYRRMGDLRNRLPQVPFMALTATATPQVRNDIVNNLNLRNPLVTCTSFDRPNLFLVAQKKSKNMIQDFKDLLKYNPMEEPPGFGGSTVVYCPTRKATEQVHAELKRMGVQNVLYHAGLSASARRSAHKSFSTDKVSVIVATVAFGMGIDKPDIRNIVHFGAPKDIESYYQEIGRAGRDGFPSVCTTLFSKADFVLNKHFLGEIQSEKFRKHKMLMMQKLEDFLETEECRRKPLLEYFDNKVVDIPQGISKTCCDNCKQQAEAPLVRRTASLTVDSSERDLGLEVSQLLRVVNDIFYGRFGLGATVCFLRGLTCKVSEAKKQNELYGCGKCKSEKWWKELGNMLRQKGYLEQEPVKGGFGFAYCIGPNGREFLKSCGYPKCDRIKPLMLKPTKEMLSVEREKDKPKVVSLDKNLPLAAPPSRWESGNRETPVSGPQKALLMKKVRDWESLEEIGIFIFEENESTEKSNPEVDTLYRELMSLRNKLADENEVAPYMVASNRALVEMTKIRPSSVDGMKSLEDFSEERVNKFGRPFLDFIKQYCDEHGLPHNDLKIVDAKTSVKLPDRCEEMRMMLSPTVLATYGLLIDERKTPGEIASFRGLCESTILSHLAEAAKVGLPVSLQALGLTHETITTVLQTVRSMNSVIGRLTPLKEALPDPNELSFGQLRIALCILEYEFGTEISSSSGERVQTDKKESPPGNFGEEKSPIRINPNLEKISTYTLKTTPPVTSERSSSKTNDDVSTETNESRNEGSCGVGGKRKLPSWMMSGGSTSNVPETKRQKSKSSVFWR